LKKKILITGLPRSGKSTLISKLIQYYTDEKSYIIYGFLTPEVRKNKKRIGFNIVDIYSKKIYQLARVGDFKSKYRVGKYCVFIDKFNKYLEVLKNIELKAVDLIIIDEIGKMELFSKKFQTLIKRLFLSNISIIATIGLKLQHSLKNYLINLPSVKLLTLNRQNAQLIFEKVISLMM
jgi:nucleoside-triphosphatase THEP1